MLYLEDYLELIEHLPQETVDRLTEMREMDLQVQNSLESVEKRTSRFFQSAYHLTSPEIEAEHNYIMKEYKKMLEDSEEKVQLANSMVDSMGKYMRRLDQDIMKFKMELEADNCGITEIIEKRLEEPDDVTPAATNTSLVSRGTRRQTYQLYSENQNKSYGNNFDSKRQDSLNSVEQKLQRLSLPTANPSHSQIMFSVDQMGAGGSAIAAAASQAIAATQQMQHGRRTTASLKASYEAINSASPGFSRNTEISNMNRELSSAAQTALAAVQTQKRNRKRRTGNETALSVGTSSMIEQSAIMSEVVEEPIIEADPDEPRYCICNEVAFGDMVACDYKKCPYEWYHYPCVGITSPPKGNWYCPQCTVTMRKRHKKSM
ncbi:hypothetical protein V9T40_009520 [Parthenolecanium corni]|uniref:Inhibitor of growth protein n=1 Tax=Parthenolecanium corni TaxID=536013 RepID=A0AAN9TMW9_9HEMI